MEKTLEKPLVRPRLKQYAQKITAPLVVLHGFPSVDAQAHAFVDTRAAFRPWDLLKALRNITILSPFSEEKRWRTPKLVVNFPVSGDVYEGNVDVWDPVARGRRHYKRPPLRATPLHVPRHILLHFPITLMTQMAMHSYPRRKQAAPKTNGNTQMYKGPQLPGC